MFLEFYQMKEQPFGVTPDPRFLYLGDSHREALASLYYGVESNRGFVALIAQPGLGKTTLTFQLLQKLQRNSRTVFLFQTQCSSKELIHYLLNGLGVDAEGMELVSMHNKLNQILSREMLAGRRFVLAIDEAQNLGPEVLETIRLLSNFETPHSKLLQILLIGQPQLAKKLVSPELEQLQQRISMFAKLEPFSSEDTARYIAHRLQVAGYSGEPLFSQGALRIIAGRSQGIPRQINRLCFSALSLGCAMGRKQVDVGMMEEVLADHDVESLQRPKIARPAAPAPEAARAVTNSAEPARVPFVSPMLARPPLTSYPASPKRSVGGWVAGSASVAALVAVVIGILSLSPERIDRFLQVSSDVWNSVRGATESIRSSATAKSDSGSVQAAEFPSAGSAQSSTSSENAETTSVVVQPGETLRQIIVRTIGSYNGDAIKQIRKLNPDIVDFDHFEPGQVIRFPLAPGAADSAAHGEESSSNGKN